MSGPTSCGIKIPKGQSFLAFVWIIASYGPNLGGSIRSGEVQDDFLEKWGERFIALNCCFFGFVI